MLRLFVVFLFAFATCYSQKIRPEHSVLLPEEIRETSGLTFSDGFLWTHNDDSDTNIYGIDTLSGKIRRAIFLKDVFNYDWEEIASDEHYFYLGDIGNNFTGNRKNLKILRFEKSSQKIDTIGFSYDRQTSFEASKANKTDFDAEAFIVTKDSIYIFTKQWKSKNTACFRLPNKAGAFVAEFVGEIKTSGLITGAVLVENTLVLCGYSKKVKPFLFFVYDFDVSNLSNLKTKKVKLKLPFHQIEGISTQDDKNFYLTNEKLRIPPIINVPAKLHRINLEKFLKN